MCNGACQAGPCLVTLATDQIGATGIAVDESNVYWTMEDGVMTVPTGGGTPRLLASGSLAWAIAVDATNVYWTNRGTPGNGFSDGSVMKCQIVGGNPIVIATQQQDPQSIAVDANNVYWVNGQTLMKEPLLNGGAATALDSPEAPINAIAVGVTDVYFTNGTSPGGVIAAPIGGGSAATLVASDGMSTAIAVNAGGIYWTGTQNGIAELFALSPGATAPSVLFGAPGQVMNGIAVDGSSVYWTMTDGSAQGGQLRSMALATVAKAETLAMGQSLPVNGYVGLAVNKASVFWISGNAVQMLTPK
jgi:hypothetical protein